MSLKKTLQKNNYDLLEGPKRNQNLLQVWIKKDTDRIALYDSSISKVFEQPFPEAAIETPALSVTSNDKEEFDFNAGMGFVKNALIQLKIADADIDSQIKSGKSVTVSYNNSYTKEVSQLDIERYLSKINANTFIPSLQKELNRDNLIVITGVIFAKNLNFTIDSNHAIDAAVEANLNKIGKGKISFKQTGQNQITLTAGAEKEFPIAVKAYRMRFAKGQLKGLKLVTDNRNFFK